MRQAMKVCGVPENLREGLVRYFCDRILPGGFLQSVLCNELAEACRRADPFTGRCLPEVMAYLDQFATPEAWGSRDRVFAWTVTKDRFELTLPYFECPRCGARSYNLNDVRERYCGRCHQFANEAGVLMLKCPLCDWSTRQQVEAPTDALKVGEYMTLALLAHMRTHGVLAEARRMHADGATHDCGEWRTPEGRCGVCDREMPT